MIYTRIHSTSVYSPSQRSYMSSIWKLYLFWSTRESKIWSDKPWPTNLHLTWPRRHSGVPRDTGTSTSARVPDPSPTPDHTRDRRWVPDRETDTAGTDTTQNIRTLTRSPRTPKRHPVNCQRGQQTHWHLCLWPFTTSLVHLHAILYCWTESFRHSERPFLERLDPYTHTSVRVTRSTAWASTSTNTVELESPREEKIV